MQAAEGLQHDGCGADQGAAALVELPIPGVWLSVCLYVWMDGSMDVCVCGQLSRLPDESRYEELEREGKVRSHTHTTQREREHTHGWMDGWKRG